MKFSVDTTSENNIKNHIALRVAICGIMTSLALVLSLVDSMIPLYGMIPGMKLGLANIVVIVTLYVLGEREAIIINILRVLLAGILFGTMQSFLFSLGGAAMSLLAMILIKYLEHFIFKVSGKISLSEVMVVSIFGAIAHITGQFLVALLFISKEVLLYYSIYLYGSSLVCGIAISVLACAIIRIIRITNN